MNQSFCARPSPRSACAFLTEIDAFLLRLSLLVCRAWTNLMCVVAANQIVLPTRADMAVRLYISAAKAKMIIAALRAASAAQLAQAAVHQRRFHRVG